MRVKLHQENDVGEDNRTGPAWKTRWREGSRISRRKVLPVRGEGWCIVGINPTRRRDRELRPSLPLNLYTRKHSGSVSLYVKQPLLFFFLTFHPVVVFHTFSSLLTYVKKNYCKPTSTQMKYIWKYIFLKIWNKYLEYIMKTDPAFSRMPRLLAKRRPMDEFLFQLSILV